MLPLVGVGGNNVVVAVVVVVGGGGVIIWSVWRPVTYWARTSIFGLAYSEVHTGVYWWRGAGGEVPLERCWRIGTGEQVLVSRVLVD